MPLLALAALLLWQPEPAFAQAAEGDPERGGELYNANCAVCHGLDGKGRIGARLEAFPGIQVDARLKQTIAQGVPGSVMPAWSQEFGGPLTEQEIADIAAYIISAFGGTQPLAPAPTYVPPVIAPLPDVRGNPSAGAVVFKENCVVCHGERGQGRIGATLAKPWAGNQPEVYIRQVIREGIPGTLMPAWSQEFGGPLSEEQIQDVTSYIISLQPLAEEATPQPPGEGPLGRGASLVILGALVALVIIGLIVYYRRA
jgi:mono/diheme cytochrome c family protein